MANPQNPGQKPKNDPPYVDPDDDTPPPPPADPEQPKCAELDPSPEPPKLEEPEPCLPQKCKCPAEPPADETCLDALITAQTQIVNEAKRAEEFKKELLDLLGKANAAKKSYTREKYEGFLKRWAKQDEDIVCAIEHVTCKVRCWECLVECEICPLLYRIRAVEQKLDGGDALITAVHSLYDLKYWHERNFAARRRRFDRIKAVLAAWNDPSKSIDAALGTNEKLLKQLSSMAPEEAVLQLFFNLIPLHLAIGPRGAATKIDSKYIELCATRCDEGEPDDCCGPDVGILTARQRLVEPQAYIVDPEDFFEILCCLAKERYLPAKDQMAKAEANLMGAQAAIDSHVAELERRKKSLFDDYRANVVTPLDCDRYKEKNGDDCGRYGDTGADPTVS